MAFVDPENVDEVHAVADKWEIDSAVIGVVRPGKTLTIRHDGEVVAEVPAASLADDAPLYDRPAARPAWLDDVQAMRADREVSDVGESLLELLSDPAIGSSAWIHTQYDHMLFLNTVVGPGSDGTLLRIKGTDKGLAVSTDGNGRLCYLDPRAGAARLVFEAALNVAVTGAHPLAVVDNLNFGNPEKPEVMWQLKETIVGVSEACDALGIPVVGGNVSFYNETDGIDIHPTPVVGLLGLADPMPTHPPRLSRAREGMEVWEVGPPPSGNLAGSSLQRLHGSLGGKPTPPSPETAVRVIALAAELAHRAAVLHDISDGGLAVALAEICIASGVGAVVEALYPFSEDPHRFLVIAEPGTIEFPTEISRRIGTMGGGQVSINGDLASLHRCADVWHQALPRALRAGPAR